MEKHKRMTSVLLNYLNSQRLELLGAIGSRNAGINFETDWPMMIHKIDNFKWKLGCKHAITFIE